MSTLESTRTTKITKNYLNSKLACYEQQATFQRLFPKGIEVTEEVAVQHFDDFDWMWAIENLLEDEFRTRALYDEAEAYRARLDARNKIHDDYHQKDDHTPEERQARVDALDETRSVYRKKIAGNFARAFLAQGGRLLLHDEEAGERTLMITADYLRERGACPQQLAKFVSLFPHGVTVSKDLALKHAEDFEWNWAIYTLLEPGDDREKAKQAIDIAEDLYRDTVQPAYQGYIKNWNDGIRRTAYERVRDAARKNLAEELATVFSHYFIKQNGRAVMEDEQL